jgi:hypothetical protein
VTKAEQVSDGGARGRVTPDRERPGEARATSDVVAPAQDGERRWAAAGCS